MTRVADPYRGTGGLARAALAIVAAAMAQAAAPPPAAAQSTAMAVEYYHAGFNHYFVTAFPGEIADLDGGAFGGAWSRTGYAFPVWTAAQPATAAACRFFSATFAPKSSHFYTPVATECASLRQGGVWTYEGIAFHLRLTDVAGNCPAGTSILYRLYNRGAGDAPNHRFTTSRAVFEQMRAAGWEAEGNGPLLAFACVPPGGIATDAVGVLEGRTATGEDIVGVVLSDGSFYFFFGDGATRVQLVRGSGTFANGTFASTDARDYEYTPGQDVVPATVTGTYAGGSSLTGVIASRGRTTLFSASYVVDPPPPMRLPVAETTMTGVAATLDGSTFGNLALSPGGRLSGILLGCNVTGTLVPRSDARVADATVVIGGSFCAIGNHAMTGVAMFESEDGAAGLVVFASNASQTNAFTFAGFALPAVQ